jgi:type IV secretory pathway VirB9-like protein
MYKYEYFVIILRTYFSKIKNNNLQNSQHPKFLYPVRFSYEEFNEHDKSKMEDDFIYFSS